MIPQKEQKTSAERNADQEARIKLCAVTSTQRRLAAAPTNFTPCHCPPARVALHWTPGVRASRERLYFFVWRDIKVLYTRLLSARPGPFCPAHDYVGLQFNFSSQAAKIRSQACRTRISLLRRIASRTYFRPPRRPPQHLSTSKESSQDLFPAREFCRFRRLSGLQDFAILLESSLVMMVYIPHGADTRRPSGCRPSRLLAILTALASGCGSPP